MAVLSHDCPHCGTKNNGFTVIESFRLPERMDRWTVFLICPSCHGGIVADVSSSDVRNDPKDHPADLRAFTEDGSGFSVLRTYPDPPQVAVPSHLPEPVAKAFKEGNEVLNTSPAAACAMFRRALELGLKSLCPEVEAWKLEKRIDKLADQHLITPAIRDWAHRLRLDGNDAVHGLLDPEREDARAMQRLSYFVLIYVFTLPAQVAAASKQEAKV